jgi:hypothetical protein
VCPVRYELGFYIPEDGILHSHRRENPNVDTISDTTLIPLVRDVSKVRLVGATLCIRDTSRAVWHWHTWTVLPPRRVIMIDFRVSTN